MFTFKITSTTTGNTLGYVTACDWRSACVEAGKRYDRTVYGFFRVHGGMPVESGDVGAPIKSARVLIEGIEDIHATPSARILTARRLARTCRAFGMERAPSALAWQGVARRLDAYAANLARQMRGADIAPSAFGACHRRTV